LKTIGSDIFFRDFIPKTEFQHKPLIIGWDLHTPENVGSLIRLGGNIGCEKVIIVSEMSHRKTSIRYTASTAFDKVNWEYCTKDQWRSLIPHDYKVIAIETAEGARDLFTAELPVKAAFMVGSERFGLPADVIEKCDMAVYIPVFGNVNSLNVSNSLAVVLFEWARQMKY